MIIDRHDGSIEDEYIGNLQQQVQSNGMVYPSDDMFIPPGADLVRGLDHG